MKNYLKSEVSSLEQSLKTADMIENTAERMFNYASISEPGYTDASIYLAKGAAEMRNEAYKSAKLNNLTYEPQIKRDLALSDAKYDMKNIMGIAICILVIVSSLLIFSQIEKTQTPTIETTEVSYEITQK